MHRTVVFRHQKMYTSDEPPLPFQRCEHEYLYAAGDSPSPWIQGFTRFAEMPAHTASQQQLDKEEAAPKLYTTNEHYNNLYGLVMQDDQHVALVAADLLGPHSYAGEFVSRRRGISAFLRFTSYCPQRMSSWPTPLQMATSTLSVSWSDVA